MLEMAAAQSQTLIVLSKEQDTICFPSGEKARQSMLPKWAQCFATSSRSTDILESVRWTLANIAAARVREAGARVQDASPSLQSVDLVSSWRHDLRARRTEVSERQPRTGSAASDSRNIHTTHRHQEGGVCKTFSLAAILASSRDLQMGTGVGYVTTSSRTQQEPGVGATSRARRGGFRVGVNLGRGWTPVRSEGGDYRRSIFILGIRST